MTVIRNVRKTSAWCFADENVRKLTRKNPPSGDIADVADEKCGSTFACRPQTETSTARGAEGCATPRADERFSTRPRMRGVR